MIELLWVQFSDVRKICDMLIIHLLSRCIRKMIRSEKNNIPRNYLVLGYLPLGKLEDRRTRATTIFSSPTVLSSQVKKMANFRAGLPSLVRRVLGTTKLIIFSQNIKTPIPTMKPKDAEPSIQ